MPPEQAFFRQWLLVALRRVEHHLDDSFNVTVGRFQAADVHPEPARDRRAHLVGVQVLPFNLTAL